MSPKLPSVHSTTRLYTDGACLWLHGPGGAAVVYIDGNREWRQRVWGISDCTNNRAELIAVIEGLRNLPTGAAARVFTDSQYVIECVHHLAKWAKCGWRNVGRRKLKRILNLDLLKQLYRVVRRRNVTFQKVAAHSGEPGNDRADQLAYLAALFTDRSSGVAGQHAVFSICSCLGNAVPMSLTGLDEVKVTPSINPLYFDPAYLPRDRSEKRRCVNTYYGSGQGAENRPVNVHDPWILAVDAHVGNHRDFLKRYARAAEAATEELLSQRLSREARTFFSKLFEFATDFRMLRCAFDLTAQSGATARGVDGMTIDDYADNRPLLVSTLKALETDMRSGHYRPRRLRRVFIPKPGGRGERPIDIPTVGSQCTSRNQPWGSCARLA